VDRDRLLSQAPSEVTRAVDMILGGLPTVEPAAVPALLHLALPGSMPPAAALLQHEPAVVEVAEGLHDGAPGDAEQTGDALVDAVGHGLNAAGLLNGGEHLALEG